uniref:Uncharacterized protein n=1 Tax=Human herpesvirus 2 TaxID=10310 RepID=A0A481THB7_HHV2|nr:hypothetical protein [Human alphaherpesvirus 2]QBH79068.1 hypothetical protein [Human alphaherpesvirus 2]QBH79335.1 hypothetical protein [Human alphaherpesvirus 2]QBH79954.1 hypothetical protein [Human alphaherpesvirus 2]QBH80171.1 hypothetical protein [Human alphaherpesvirus 2]
MYVMNSRSDTRRQLRSWAMNFSSAPVSRTSAAMRRSTYSGNPAAAAPREYWLVQQNRVMAANEVKDAALRVSGRGSWGIA